MNAVSIPHPAGLAGKPLCVSRRPIYSDPLIEEFRLYCSCHLSEGDVEKTAACDSTLPWQEGKRSRR